MSAHRSRGAEDDVRIPDVPDDQQTMSTVLREQALHFGDAPFVLFEDDAVSYAEADRIVDGYARGLVEAGIKPASNVALVMENGPEFLWLTLALNRLAAVSVPVNTAYKGTFLRHVLAQ